MMAASKGDGFFFALPTMATSDAMLARIEGIVPRLFDGRVSLALTHGRARMNELFRKIQGRDGSDPGGGPSCGPWLADDRRRILLADVGVGTIDQALMAVLPTRFNTLRLRALSGHILVVDEAHEFDPLHGSAIATSVAVPRVAGRFRDRYDGNLAARHAHRLCEGIPEGSRNPPTARRHGRRLPDADRHRARNQQRATGSGSGHLPRHHGASVKG